MTRIARLGIALVTFASISPLALHAQATPAGVGSRLHSSFVRDGFAAGAAAAVGGVISKSFKGDEKTSVRLSRAPEVSTSGAVSGLVLLLGGCMMIRGRQRTQE